MVKVNFTTFTGTQKGLTIVGSHFYCYSGAIDVQSTGGSPLTFIEFNTGKEYLKGWVTLMDGDGWNSGQQLEGTITFNGLTVVNLYVRPNTAYNDNWDLTPFPLIIPPLTEVKVLIESNIDAAHFITAGMTGRVYNV